MKHYSLKREVPFFRKTLFLRHHFRTLIGRKMGLKKMNSRKNSRHFDNQNKKHFIFNECQNYGTLKSSLEVVSRTFDAERDSLFKILDDFFAG